jgi:hypothetical protein
MRKTIQRKIAALSACASLNACFYFRFWKKSG